MGCVEDCLPPYFVVNYTIFVICCPLLIVSWVNFNNSWDDQMMLLQFPNTHQVIDDWDTNFITDIKVIDYLTPCDPGETEIFEYQWLGLRKVYYYHQI